MNKKERIFHERRDTRLPEGVSLDAASCTVETVNQAICYRFRVTEEMLKSKSRERSIVYPRQLAFYFLSINKSIGSGVLAGMLGRDHATMFNSRNRIEGFIDIYPDTLRDVEDIAEYIKWLHQIENEMKMKDIPVSRIRYFYFLLDQLGIRWMKNDLVMDASQGRTESVRELLGAEMDQLILHLEEKIREAKNDASPKTRNIQRMDRMRKRIFSICYTIGWTTIDPEKNRHIVDQNRLNGWLIKYGYLHKELNDYTYLELPTLITQFERLLKSTLATYEK